MSENGKLAFVLGLEGGNFLSTLGRAKSALVGFISASVGAGAIVKGIFAAFERGADIQRLSARTGESVGNLYLLQKAFQSVGMESDSLSGMLFHLQKALSGMSEEGEETVTVFAMLGLSMQQIRAMSAPQQLQAIANAMHGMGRAQSAIVASRLFGREGAQNFLQMARSGRAFADALNDNAAAAERMARNASAFNQIEISMARLKSHAQDFFAGLAEGAAPGLQSLLDVLNRIDLSGLGQKFGTVITAFAQSIKDARLGDIILLSMNAGLEQVENSFLAMLAGMEAAMSQFMRSQLHHLGELMGANVTALQGVIQVGTGRPDRGVQTIFKAAQMWLGTGSHSADQAVTAFAYAFQRAQAGQSHAAADALLEFIRQEAARAPHGSASGHDEDRPPSPLAKPFDFTSVEKMGFHFGAGGPSILADHAARTAAATARTAQNTQIIANAVPAIIQIMHGAGGGGIALPN